MSKKKKSVEEELSDLTEAFETKEEVAKSVKPKAKPAPVPVFSFDRWFGTTGRPAHHKAGMRAYLNKSQLRGKRTLDAWNVLFEKY